MEKVYKDSNWKEQYLMFSYNSKHRYYAYIDGQVFLETGEIKFKDACHITNKGKPSKVGQHILERSSIIEVKHEKKENSMETKNVNYIGGEYKIVKVKYLDSEKYYNFKADIDLNVKEDDLVVVESSVGLRLATISSIIPNTIENAETVRKATAWVVNVVDTARQDQRKEATKKREYIIQQLEEKKAQMETISMYALLAKSDPEAKRLLKELKQLGN